MISKPNVLCTRAANTCLRSADDHSMTAAKSSFGVKTDLNWIELVDKSVHRSESENGDPPTK